MEFRVHIFSRVIPSIVIKTEIICPKRGMFGGVFGDSEFPKISCVYFDGDETASNGSFGISDHTRDQSRMMFSSEMASALKNHFIAESWTLTLICISDPPIFASILIS